jgi:AraC-like DNA-binding protein
VDVKVIENYKSKKYLLRILLSISCIIVIILLFSSTVLHYSSETRVLHMQEEANRKVMNQINRNLSYMNEIINNLAVTLYSDMEIVPLMLNPNDMDVIRSTQRLQKSYISSSFLHSILIYNGHNGKAYTAGQLSYSSGSNPPLDRLVHLLKSKEKQPRMELIPMNFSGEAHRVDFFSYIMYESYYDDNENESVLVLNIKPQWIFDNLKIVNDFAAPQQSSVFIIDEAGQIIISGNQENIPEVNLLRQTIADKSGGGQESFSFFSREIGGKKYVISFMDMGINRWKVVSIQPYNAVLGGIYEMRVTSVLVILCFFVLSIGASIYISHKLYRPVDIMLKQIRSHSEHDDSPPQPEQDELTYVSSVYSSMAKRLGGALYEQNRQRTITKNYHMRRLLLDSSLLSAEEWMECIRQNGLRLDLQGGFLVTVVKIDDYRKFAESTSPREKAMYSFAISNIAEETVTGCSFLCETVDTRNDHLVLLVSGISAENAQGEELPKLMETIQEIVWRYYKLSLSIAISGVFEGYGNIALSYSRTLQISIYKLLFGRKALVTPELVASNMEQLEYIGPAELDKKLAEGIKTNDLPLMESTVGQLLQYISAFHYDHIVHGLLHVVDIIKTTVRELNKNRVTTLRMDLSTLSQRVLEQETMSDILELLLQTCRELHDQLKHSEQDKNDVLIDAIKEAIELNYTDMGYSLQSVASMLRMTPAYIGRMFRQSEMMSVGEYINEVRLNSALHYLETKSYSIKEIMELVGYSNESTFFKLFKKKFGVTPKEYRLKNNIK